MQKSETIAELAKALAAAQGQMKGALKDSANPFFKSKYADLSSVWEACREPLSKNGLSVVQTTTESEDILVETILLHSSGEYITSLLKMKPVKNDPQGIGSAITYARRYGLAAMVGVAPEEDDGNAASGKDGKGQTPIVKIADEVKNQVHEQSLSCLERGDESGLKQIWDEFGVDEKVVLWGLFNSQQRSAMKKLMAGGP